MNVSEELSTTAVDTTPKAVTVGNAKIIADQRANAIIVLGNREVVVKVQRPGIRAQVVEDLDALEAVAQFLDDHTAAGRQFGDARLLESIGRRRSDSLQEGVDGLLEEVERWRGGASAQDDISILAVGVSDPAGSGSEDGLRASAPP